MHAAFHIFDACIGWVAIAGCIWSAGWVTFRG